MWEDAVFEANDEHGRELQALGRVQCHEHHAGVVVGQLVLIGDQADRFEELLDVLVLAGDADQLGQVLESTLRLQRPRGLEFRRVAGAVENRLEDDARAVVDGPKTLEEIDRFWLSRQEMARR